MREVKSITTNRVFRQVPEPSAVVTVHRDKSESPFTRLAARCLFLKFTTLASAKQTSKALPGAVRSKAFLSFHLTERQSIMIRWGGRNGARLPAASPLVKLFKRQAPQAQSINQKGAAARAISLGPGQGSGRPAHGSRAGSLAGQQPTQTVLRH